MSTNDQNYNTGMNVIDYGQHAAPCPSCGHCPTCGRGGVGASPWARPYPWGAPWSPIWVSARDGTSVDTGVTWSVSAQAD